MTRTSSFQSTNLSFCRRGSWSSDYCNEDPARSPSAVPVRDPGGRMIAVMLSSGPVEKHPRDEVEGQAVRRIAAALGRSPSARSCAPPSWGLRIVRLPWLKRPMATPLVHLEDLFDTPVQSQ